MSQGFTDSTIKRKDLSNVRRRSQVRVVVEGTLSEEQGRFVFSGDGGDTRGSRTKNKNNNSLSTTYFTNDGGVGGDESTLVPELFALNKGKGSSETLTPAEGTCPE